MMLQSNDAALRAMMFCLTAKLRSAFGTNYINASQTPKFVRSTYIIRRQPYIIRRQPTSFAKHTSNDAAPSGNDVLPYGKIKECLRHELYKCVADSKICAKHIHHSASAVHHLRSIHHSAKPYIIRKQIRLAPYLFSSTSVKSAS